jgi:Na+/melibiose symporter-like transporter
VASGGALLLAGVLLSFFGRIAPVAPTALPHAPAAAPLIGLSYGVVPGVLLVAATLMILPYKLNRKSLHVIQTQLAERRNAESGKLSAAAGSQ